MKVNTMCNHFRISFGVKLITKLLQFIAQIIVILDDAVVHDGNAVFGYVWMRIPFSWSTMCRPASMRNAHASRGRTIVQRILQVLHLANSTQARKLLAIGQHSHAG